MLCSDLSSPVYQCSMLPVLINKTTVSPMDILAGFCVGWSEVLVGYPFLTAKVLTQNGLPWWGHSLRRYYQGVRYPLVSSIGFNIVVFPKYTFVV